MSVLVLAGAGCNQIERAATAPVPESANAAFPIENLYDGKPWKPFMFATAAASGYIDFDLNQVPNGGFESAFSGGLPAAGWGLSSATASRVTSPVAVGSGAMEVVASSTGGGVYYDLHIASGQQQVWLKLRQRGTGGAVGAALSVRNLATGNYLAPGGNWQSAATVVQAATTLATWDVAGDFTFNVESQAACGNADMVVLRFLFHATGGAGTVYFDEVEVAPALSFVALIGHNVPPSVAVQLLHGSTSPAANVAATITHSSRTMYAAFPLTSQSRYWRLSFSPDPLVDPLWIGEAVMGQYETLLRGPAVGTSERVILAQDRDASGAYVREALSRRVLKWRTLFPAAADYAQALAIAERSRLGAIPLTIVADDSDATSCMQCRADTFSTRKPWPTAREGDDVELTELPFPVVIA